MESIIKDFLTSHNYTNIHPKAILFDMDGVLYDSMKNHTQAWFKAITELKIECSLDEFYLYEGQTGKRTITQLINRAWHREPSEQEKTSIYNQKTKYFNELGQAPVMPGAAETLSLVKQLQLTPVLVTGSGQASLIGKLEKNFPGIFTSDTMVTAHDVKHGKPDPEPYLMGLEKAGCSASEAVVIENAPLGVQASAAAGIFTIAVNTGPLTDECLYKAGAQIVLSGMKELEQRLELILSDLEKTTL